MGWRIELAKRVLAWCRNAGTAPFHLIRWKSAFQLPAVCWGYRLVGAYGDRADQAEALHDYGNLLLRYRDAPVKAEAAFERAWALNSGYYSRRSAEDLADSRRTRGDLAGAASVYQRLMATEESTVDRAKAAYELARVHRQLGDLDQAVAACRTAIELGHSGAGELLAELLESRGDTEGAEAARNAAREAAARAADTERTRKLVLVRLLAALEATGHNYTYPRAERFTPYVVAILRPAEQVEHVGWALMRVPGSPTGYLVLTNQRLLLLDDIFYPDTHPGVPDAGFHPLLPRYEYLVIDRTAITRCAPVEDDSSFTVSFDEQGGSVLSATGDPVPTTEITFQLRNRSIDPWLDALSAR